MFDSFDDDQQNENTNNFKFSNFYSNYLNNNPSLNETNSKANNYMELEEEENDDDKDEEDVRDAKKEEEKNHVYLNSFIQNKLDLYVNRPFEIVNNPQQSRSSKSLKEKLFDLYLEESKKNTSNKFLSYSTNLLEKLVKREKYHTIVLNFYAADQGYSLGFNIKPSSSDDNNNTNSNDYLSLNKIETKLLSYDENDLLFYINTGEIPPILIDLIDHLNVNLFYDGCLILEIRDFRRRSSSLYETHYVLLQPSMQTLLADINSLTNNGSFIWTQEDKYALESQLLLATTQPLCLNPSPIVSIIKNQILCYKYKINDRNLKKLANRYSESYKMRANKWSDYQLPYPFRILKIRKKYQNTNEYLQFQNDYLNKLNEIKLLKQEHKPLNEINLMSGSPGAQNTSSILNFHSVDNWSKSNNVFKLPSEDTILVKKFAKKFETPKYTNESILNAIEEIILEAADKTSKNNYSKLLIKRRSDDGSYYCKLSLRSDQKNQVLFRLGTASEAEKYIQQYVKIFTEDGRRAVTIKHNLLEKINTTNLTDNKQPINNANLINYSNSTLKKPVNSSPVLSGIQFQSYFDSKTPIEFNDKQILSYQTFLQQQLIQQKLQQQQQLEQIRRTKSMSEESSNLKSLINQNTPSSSSSSLSTIVSNPTVQPINNPTPKIYTNIQPARPNSQNETINLQRSLLVKKQSEPIITTTTTTTTSTQNLVSLNSKQTNQTIDVEPQTTTNLIQYQPLTTTKLNSTSSSTSLTTNSNQNNNNFIQIYVPKLISTPSGTTNSANNSPNTTKTSPSDTQGKKVKNSTPKRQPKKRTNSTTTPTTTTTSTPSTQIANPLNLAPKLEKTTSTPNTKIINASNLNLLKKIAIDNRTMPVIVTLNSNDSTLNNKLTIKQTNDESPIKSLSPIKATTVQLLQKSTPTFSKLTTMPISESVNITPVTSISSPMKKSEPEIRQNNFILPSTVKTIPLNSKTTPQQFLLENHFSLNANKTTTPTSAANTPTTSIILVTNNANSNTKLIHSTDNTKS